jgi:Spy/CpxP family protein refolding chaperone
MKKVMLMMGLMMALGTQMVAQQDIKAPVPPKREALDMPPPPPPPPSKEMQEKRFEKMKSELKLTPEQEAKMKALMEKNREANKAKRQEMKKKMKEENKAQREAMRAEMEKVLTPEQMEKFKQMRKAEKKERKEHKKDM